MRPDRLLGKLLRNDFANVSFEDLVRLITALGFREVGGRRSHRVFACDDVHQLLNLQEKHGDAKIDQVRQVANLVRQYTLKIKEK